jgi:beta-N-acetylhexosaminidase
MSATQPATVTITATSTSRSTPGTAAPPTTTSASTGQPSVMGPSTSAGSAGGCPARVLASMSWRQRVGQLFVAGVRSTAAGAAELQLIRRNAVGGVILTGPSSIGVAGTRRITDLLQAQADHRSTQGVRLWVSADQEGGNVQELHGPGFSELPTAFAQGQLSVSALRSLAFRWGQQLRAAGVNLDLAPVMDTVPAALGTANRPIGYYYREYGNRPAEVAAHAVAFVRGMQRAGVQTTAKHFPGLGRVLNNTDTSAHVTDDVTTRHDGYLLPFRRAIDAQIPVVMVSSARYSRIDPGRIAAFSPTILDGMLREDLGFTGVIISDALNAVALDSYPVRFRALRFFQAGGTVALTTQQSDLASMENAVLRQAGSHRELRRQLNADALTVLRVKQRANLVPC